MAVALDATRFTEKAPNHGNYGAGPYLYSGRLYYAATLQLTASTANVVVWALVGGIWVGYTGPALRHPTTAGGSVYQYTSISADATGNSLWIAYQGFAATGDVSDAPEAHVIRFDLDAHTYGTAVVCPDTEPYTSAIHTNLAGDLLADLELRVHVWATSSSAFTLAYQGTIGGITHSNVKTRTYSGSWGAEAVRGRNSTLSDLLVGGFTGGGTQFLLFVSGDGALFVEPLGSGYTSIASNLKIITATGFDGRKNFTSFGVGKAWYDSATGDIVIPYKDSSDRMAAAKRISGAWSTEVIDATKTPYNHYFASTQRESRGGNIAAAVMLAGEWQVLWWDDANNLNNFDGSPAVSAQTLWRSRYVSGAWTAPTAAITGNYWQCDVDLLPSGSTLHLIFQRYDSVYLSPFYEALGGSSGIDVPSIESGLDFGEYSGLTGGKPGGGDGCGSGVRLPAGGAGVRPGCSTYTSV